MKTATITEVKNGLSALLDRVRGGETIVVTDRGVPIARIEAVRGALDASGRISRLERAGVITPAHRPPPLERLRRPAADVPAGTSAVGTLLDERRTGR